MHRAMKGPEPDQPNKLTPERLMMVVMVMVVLVMLWIVMVVCADSKYWIMTSGYE